MAGDDRLLVESYEYHDGEVVVVRFRLGRESIEFMANVEIHGNVLMLRRCHVQGDLANRVGVARLLALGRWIRQELDVDELRIEGGTRATGANPGHSPRPIVFR